MYEYFFEFGRRLQNASRNRLESRVHIGRDGRRAFLVDHLKTTGARTAVLVTGRRGAGKTAFVEHCLKEHEISVVERFLASQQGRPILGLLLLFSMAFLIPLALLFASNVLEMLTPMVFKGKLIFVLIVLPALFVTLSPLIYSFIVTERLLRAYFDDEGKGTLSTIITISTLATLSIGLFPSVHSPAVFLLNIIFAAMIIATFWDIVLNARRRGSNDILLSFKSWTLVLLSLIVSMTALFVAKCLFNSYPHFSLFLTIVLGSYFIFARSLTGDWDSGVGRELNGFTVLLRMVLGAVSVTILAQMINSFLFSYTMMGDVEAGSTFWPVMWAIGLAMALAFLQYMIRVRPNDRHYTDAIDAGTLFGSVLPGSLIILKILSLIMISLHLSYPVVGQLIFDAHRLGPNSPAIRIETTDHIFSEPSFSQFFADGPDGDYSDISDNDYDGTGAELFHVLDLHNFRWELITARLHARHVPAESTRVKSALSRNQRSDSSTDYLAYPTVFKNERDGRYFAVLFLIGVIMLYFLEWEMLIRPVTPIARSRPLQPLGGLHRDTVNRSDSQKPVEPNKKVGENIQKRDRDIAAKIRKARNWQRTTLAHPVLAAWSPSLVVRVNLGFEGLNHQSVTQAMLRGLADEYKERFLSSNRPYFLVSIFALALVSLNVTNILAQKFFALSQGSSAYATLDSTEPLGDPCSVLQATVKPSQSVYVPILPLTLCSTTPGLANRVIPFLYAPVLQVPVDPVAYGSNLAVFNLLGENYPPPAEFYRIRRDKPVDDASIVQDFTLRVFHIVIFLFVLFLLRVVTGTYNPFLPYRRMHKRIENAYLSMTTSQTSRRRSFRSLFDRLPIVGAGDQEQTVIEGQRDPRSVELVLMGILRDIQQPELGLPLGRRLARFVPWPEVTFVFDELDKITGLVSPDAPAGQTLKEERSALSAQRRRTYALRNLLSDMKRLISSSPARFIFVGNRALHEEIIADRTRREAHLTSIFDVEIYLPSLLVDGRRVRIQDTDETAASFMTPHRWDTRVREFLIRHFRAAKESQKRYEQNFARPFFALRRNKSVGPIFPLDHEATGDNALDLALPVLERVDTSGSTPETVDHKARSIKSEGFSSYLRRAFVGYLTFRSAGNPKRLNQIFDEFIRSRQWALYGDQPFPAGKRPADYGDHIHDVIHLRPNDVYRIELVNYLYRHIAEHFDQGAASFDDKRSVSLLFLFEFLLKFHTRAFSWTSLERVEELAHIYRSPELRNQLHEIVQVSEDRFLHPVLNGQYGYRFIGEFSAELRYASKISEVEQEAFNFSLDESQDLKAAYQVELSRLEATNQDIVFGLGELHEYDQEYDAARHHYRHCVRLTDEGLFYHIGRDGVDISVLRTLALQSDADARIDAIASLSSPTLAQVLTQDDASETLKAYLLWAPKRVRLMLHIGMTEELTRNLPTALHHYLDAAQLASQSIRAACLASRKDGFANRTLINGLKNMNVLFQPVFAAAWVAEARRGGVDAGPPIIESFLAELRHPEHGLPFYGEGRITLNEEMVLNVLGRPVGRKTMPDEINTAEEAQLHKIRGKHSNFALIGSELHNKAGDLYFFKGRAIPSYDHLNRLKATQPKHSVGAVYRKTGSGLEGHTFKAHYHYSVALHQLRRFIFYRQAVSRFSLNHLQSFWSSDSEAPLKAASQRETYADALTSLEQDQEAAKWFSSNTPAIEDGTTRNVKVPTLKTITGNDWPEFVALSVYSNLTDLADSFFARTSLTQISLDMAQFEDCPDIEGLKKRFEGMKPFLGSDEELKDAHEKFQATLRAWMSSPDANTHLSCTEHGPYSDLVCDSLGAWYEGLSKAEKSAHPIDDVVVFGAPTSSMERVILGILFGCAGARTAAQTGRNIQASREYLRIVAMILSILEHLDKQLREEKRDNFLKPTRKLAGALYRHACYAIDRFCGLHSLVFTTNRKGTPNVKLAVTLICCLDLVMKRLNETAKKQGGYELASRKLIEDWFNVIFGKSYQFPWHGQPLDAKNKSYDILEFMEQRFPFPVANRLRSMRSRLVHDLRTKLKTDEVSSGEIKARARELTQLYKDFDSPTYLAPGELALTLEEWVTWSDAKHTDILHRSACQFLDQAEALVRGTLSESAYVNRHYLYDDFNDRQMHSIAAQQMLSADALVEARQRLHKSV